MIERSPEGPAGAFTLRVGSVSILLLNDPIETILRTSGLDAVVSSDDSMLSMDGGVSAAIAGLAGRSVREELVHLLPLPVGSIAISSGGRLPIRHIIHAVTVDRANRVLPTRRTIRQLLREILSRCEALQIRRVAMPALAAGAAGFPPDESARLIAGAIYEHAINPTTLDLLVVSIPGSSSFATFVHELVSLIPQAVSLEPVPADDRRVEVYGDDNYRLRFKRTLDITTETAVGHPAAFPRAGKIASLAGDLTSRPLLGGRYVLLEELGRGGMAIVYLSWDIVLRKAVAIKVLRPDAADPLSLRREAAAALELTHEGIVRLYHFEPTDDRKGGYLVMEYLSWPSGEKWIADAGDSRLPTRPVLDVGLRLCDALAHAHSRNVLHLDVKPSNVFVDPGGENAKIADFGLARVVSASQRGLQLTRAGTPAYMAPEQIAPGGIVSQATDAYQLAATLWDFLTGSAPDRSRAQPPGLEPARASVLSILRQVLVPDPALRPSMGRLREMLAASR